MIKKFAIVLVGSLGMVFALTASAGAAPATAEPPALPPNAPFGYYISTDGHRVHLRTTDGGGDPSRYHGVISTNGQLRNVDLIRQEDEDWAINTGDALQFHFRTAGATDGVSFTVLGSDRVTFRLYRDGHLIRTQHIFVNGPLNPADNPFSIIL